jgi:hypothetical protein
VSGAWRREIGGGKEKIPVLTIYYKTMFPI